MEGEPVDRRGLFRDLIRQAADRVVPTLGLDLVPRASYPQPQSPLAIETATPEQLLDAAGSLGLERRANAITELSRRSLRVVPAARSSGGEVEFGGRALMNEGQPWPSWMDRPLTFLAQVETGEPLGRLLFFYDAVGRPSGCLAAHLGTACVLQANDSRLVPADGPALPGAAVHGLLAREVVLPAARSAPVEALELEQSERDAWEALRDELAAIQGTELADRPGAAFRVVHRIFGYPDGGGEEMPLTCELAVAGEDVIEGRAHLHPEAGRLGEQAGRWELLAQFSGDGKLGWPWVAQRVCFWVDRDALAAGDLSGVWAIAR